MKRPRESCCSNSEIVPHILHSQDSSTIFMNSGLQFCSFFYHCPETPEAMLSLSCLSGEGVNACNGKTVCLICRLQIETIDEVNSGDDEQTEASDSNNGNCIRQFGIFSIITVISV